MTAPVFVLLSMGVIDIGNAISEKFDMTSWARSGAEYGLTHSGDIQGVRQVVYQTSGRDETNLTVDVAVLCECDYQQGVVCDIACATGDQPRRYIRVAVSSMYNPLFLPKPDKPETDKYTFFQELTLLGATVTLRIE